MDDYSYFHINIRLCGAFARQKKIQVYYDNGQLRREKSSDIHVTLDASCDLQLYTLSPCIGLPDTEEVDYARPACRVPILTGHVCRLGK